MLFLAEFVLLFAQLRLFLELIAWFLFAVVRFFELRARNVVLRNRVFRRVLLLGDVMSALLSIVYLQIR